MKRIGGWEYWERKAHSFDRWNTRITEPKTERLLDEWLQSKLGAGDSVIELGCGTGRYTTVIAKTVAQVVAGDQSPAMLLEAQKKTANFKNVSVQREDCFGTTFPDTSFDVVFMGTLLHIVQLPERAVAEARRLLKPGGRLLAIDYTSNGMTFFAIARMAIAILTTWGLPSKDNQVVSPEDIRRMVADAGLNVKTCELLGPSVKAVCLQAVKQ